MHDIQNLERGSKFPPPGRLLVDLSPPGDDGLVHLKLFLPERAITLSEVLPLIENMGLRVEYMGGPYAIQPRDNAKPVYIHECVGRPAQPPVADLRHSKPLFEEAFFKVWTGEAENDPFNALTLRAGMAWREIIVMRAFARYLRQLRIPYSHEMMAQTFLAHPHIAQQIYALFFARHSPDLKGDRTARCTAIEEKINEALAQVSVLEDDRVIRRYLNLVQSSLRTNYFQTQSNGDPHHYTSFKFDSRAVDFMPLPKPLYEIFVHSPRTEAVHLRGGKVARGGIRWSDRREDFRNEILGLMKAQMVKNSVIVPVGSKGGFIVKRPPPEADKFQAEGVACYRIMMKGLLDITDNRINGKIVPPARVVRHDADDPYLVVAADKGTAKFSDIANGIAQEYGFWLDDAFASGGSAGYDHKEMAITARGAWEAIKRHFREMGKDIQTTDFTCIGIGDMSGDVFGNGMLLSKHIRLLGAFDHRHVFCDPNPDTTASFNERERLFGLPRSSWGDYDPKKISKGGGVFPRSAKTLRLTPEMKKAYGVTADSLGPAELIQAMLRAEVELLYFGGIGTFIKAGSETHEDIGDRASEPLRIDASEVRAKVVGEGANLGVTQRGRVEYALKGGRINTDAIDNSAGVDTSDHEVNIKILLRKIVDRGDLTIEARNKLLRSMTDEVAQLVLEDNYRQTQILSISEARAAEILPFHVRAINMLEKLGLLNRDVEFLPHSTEVAERQRMGKGLMRPEIAVLMAYAKLWLYQQLIGSELPDDDYLQGDLMRYFPQALQKKYAKDIRQHQLHREIIATTVTNSVVNYSGPAFVMVMADRTEKDAIMVTRAYLLARESFDLMPVWHEIEMLDAKIHAAVQIQMHIVVRQVLIDFVHWFLTSIDIPPKLAALMKSYREGVESLSAWVEKSPKEINGRYIQTESEFVAKGVPAALARRIALMPALVPALDLTRLGFGSRDSMAGVAEIYFGLGKRLGFDWLADQAHAIVAQTPWQREAVSGILNDLAASQKRLTAAVVGKSDEKKAVSPANKMANWLHQHIAAVEHHDALLGEMRSAKAVDISMLMLAARALGTLGT